MSQPKLTFGRSNVQLDPARSYEFLFGTSFPTESAARACIGELSSLGLSDSLAQGGNNRWIANLRIIERANPKRITELAEAVRAAVAKHGGVLVVSGASQPPSVHLRNAG